MITRLRRVVPQQFSWDCIVKWPLFHVFLDDWIIKFSTNKSFGIVNSVFRISSYLIFSRIPDQPFGFSKSNKRGSCSISLIVSNNFNSFVLIYSYTRVGCSKINSYSGSFNLFFRHFYTFNIYSYQQFKEKYREIDSSI